MCGRSFVKHPAAAEAGASIYTRFWKYVVCCDQKVCFLGGFEGRSLCESNFS